MLKREVRIIAWDDCGFRFAQKSVRIVGAVFRGGQFLDGLLSTIIKKDGSDVTDKISAAILRSRHYSQLSYVMTNGISFGGMNILDIKDLYRRTKMPVIAVVRKQPDKEEFISALKKFPDYKKRADIVRKTGSVIKYGDIFYQKSGLTKKECEDILSITCIWSKIPEPIRVAHLIASGLSRQTSKETGYESKGRA